LGRSGAAGCFAAWLARARCGDATPPRADPARPAPPERGGEIFSGRADSHRILRIRRGPVAPISKSDPGRETGCTRVRPGLRLLSRSTARLVRSVSAEASSTRPLQEQAHGSIGAGPLATATLPTDSAAEQGLEAGSRKRSRRRGSQPQRRQARRPVTARRNRPSVTTGRLLTRGTLRRVGHDRGRTCERGPLAHDPCGPGAERHQDGSRGGGHSGRSRNGMNPRVGCRGNADGSWRSES